MKKQARGIAPRILMPKEATKIKLQEFFAAHVYSKDDPNRIKVPTAVVDEVAAFFHVPKVSVKYRMVDLGFMSHDDSLKIYSDDSNGTFKWDFAERPLIVKTSDQPITRHITLEHAFYEFSRNTAFREILQSGHFRHVKDTFVINDPKYIYKDVNCDFKLTKYAIEHPQECALIFEYTLNPEYGKAINDSLNAVGSWIGWKRHTKSCPDIPQTFKTTRYSMQQRHLML